VVLPKTRKAVFLDRDGVINADAGYLVKPEDFRFLPGVFDAIRRLDQAGYAVVVVTNQSGIARGFYTEEAYLASQAWLMKTFEDRDAPIEAVYYCPHHPDKGTGPYRIECDCRKPAPGLILRAADELGIDLGSSAIVGDKIRDVEAGRRAGIPLRILVGTDALDVPALAPPATHAARGLPEAADIILEAAK